ncbi:MAG: hypothetical protein R3E97_14740 [Candidatus Eisenbacteria bacterium]
MAATVTFDGTVFDSVGVRLKGNSSYTHPNDKKPFRLKLDEFIGGRRSTESTVFISTTASRIPPSSGRNSTWTTHGPRGFRDRVRTSPSSTSTASSGVSTA